MTRRACNLFCLQVHCSGKRVAVVLHKVNPREPVGRLELSPQTMSPPDAYA
jgi:hypothetical protein